MRPGVRRAVGAALLCLLLGDGSSRAQLPPGLPPPPPAAHGAWDAPLATCVPRFGDAGCAAHLYAQALCALVGQRAEPTPWQRWLEQRYGEAGIRFDGLTVEQIERLAVAEQVPQLCPASAEAIHRLFSAPAQP